MLAFRASSTLASDISSKYTTEKGAIRIIGWHLITEESKRLLQSLTNGANVVLMSPRRVGKTQLIYYCFEKRAISDNYITIFIDILKTSTLQEFTYELGKAVFNTLATRGQKMQKMVMTTMRSLMGNIGIDPVTALPTFGIAIGEIQNPTYSLEEIFRTLESAGKLMLSKNRNTQSLFIITSLLTENVSTKRQSTMSIMFLMVTHIIIRKLCARRLISQ